MRRLKILGLPVLLVACCLLAVWGGMAVAQAVVATSDDAPAAVPPGPSATGSSAGASRPGTMPRATGVPRPSAGVVQLPNRRASSSRSSQRGQPVPDNFGKMLGPLGVTRTEDIEDLLKKLTDLGSATRPELEEADRILESRTRRLAEQYAQEADEQAREKLKQELNETIQKHFDVRHQIREEEISQLEARVKRLRDLLEKRKQARDSIVETRLQQFVRAAEGLGWDADLQGRGSSSSRLGFPRPQISYPTTNPPAQQQAPPPRMR